MISHDLDKDLIALSRLLSLSAFTFATSWTFNHHRMLQFL